MANTPLFSKLMSVVLDASTVGCATNFAVNITKDMIQTSCLTSSGAKNNIPDMYGWTITGSGLVIRTTSMTAGTVGPFEIASKFVGSDASVLVSLLPDVSSNKYFEGVGYFSSLSMEGGVGAPVTYSFEIAGDGALSTKTTS